MAGRLQLRRGTTAQNNAFTGAVGELTFDTDTNGVRVHDGHTQGGFPFNTVIAFQRPTAANNYTWYRKWSDGWVEQGGTTGANSDSQYSFNLPVAMADTNYQVLIGLETTNTSGAGYGYVGIRSKTTTSITLWSNTAYITKKHWTVVGMAA